MLKENYNTYAKELSALQLKHFRELRDLASGHDSIQTKLEDLAVAIVKDTKRVHRDCDNYEVSVISDTIYVDQLDYNGECCSCIKLTWQEIEEYAAKQV